MRRIPYTTYLQLVGLLALAANHRKTLGFTQRDLGRRVGMSAPWISQAERGQAPINDAMLARLREAIRALRTEQEK